MKNFKKAFTLAELLLCLGIIGVISAMGLVIAKHGTDKAYNLFYYNGYINLYNAIADARSSSDNIDELTNTQIMEHVAAVFSNNAAMLDNKTFTIAQTLPSLNFMTYKAYGLQIDDQDLKGDSSYWENNKNDLEYNDKNNYDSRYPTSGGGLGTNGSGGNGGGGGLGGLGNGGNPDKSDDDVHGDGPGDQGDSKGDGDSGVDNNGAPPEGPGANVEIDNPETWPGPNTAGSIAINTINGITYYYPNTLNSELNGIDAGAEVTSAIPITMTVPQRKTRTNDGIATVLLVYVNADNGYLIPVAHEDTVDLQTRRDLLPAYIDNGRVGRNNAINRNNFEFQRIAYASYRDAFCTIRNNRGLGSLITCGGAQTVFPREGILKIGNPRNAK